MDQNHQKSNAKTPLEPHVLMFPIPLQGPVNCFLKLAELLCLSGIQVTFLNTDHIHRHLLRNTNILSRFNRYPNFRYESIPDGVDFENPASGDNFEEVIKAANVVSKPLFREMMISGKLSRRSERPVTAMILDAFFSFTVEVGLETSTPVFCFQTLSPCCSWTCFFNLPALINAGDVPFKGFKFHVINGLYDGPMNTGETLSLMIADSLPKVATPFLRNLLLDTHVTCLIADGIMGFALDAAQGTGVPVLFFRTISACAIWAYFCIQELTESGEFPFEGTNMDKLISNVKGMEGFLRRRDLPNCLSNQASQLVSSITRRMPEAHALILNTFDDLEGPILSQIQKHCSNIYTIGPLHAQLKARSLSTSASSNSLFQEDKTCIGWLDQQAPKSVLYVSFGSITTLTRDQIIEFWHGLVNSGIPFLWVIREDLVSNTDENKVPTELEEGTKQRGYIVGWAPQEDVLAHPSVCAFLTHNGWNSTLESIVEGIPMVSWPFFADQQINSRFVEAVWKLGLDMKDTCDRKIVEKIVKEVMEVRKMEFTESAFRMAKLAKKSVNEGGSSYNNLNRLIEDIKIMDVRSQEL